MKNLPQILRSTFPDLDLSAVTVRDDGAGEYLHRWDSPFPQPDDAELQAMHDAWHADAERLATEAAQLQEAIVRAGGARRLAALAGDYAPAERETWDTQQREARAWLADNAAPTPMLSAIAAGRGIALADLVAKVMANVEAFEAASGAILGQQQALLDALAAVDPAAADALDQIAVITWES